MDDLIEFASDSDKAEEILEIPSNEQILKDNSLALHMWKDLLSAHQSSVKELNYFSKEVNAIVEECKADPAKIKCMEWKCGLRLDKLPDTLQPGEFSKCQLNLNRTNPVQRNHRKICKNYTQSCTKPKNNNPGYKSKNPSNGNFSRETNTFNISTSQSNITFNFKPNYNINHSSVQINSTKLCNTDSITSKPGRGASDSNDNAQRSGKNVFTNKSSYIVTCKASENTVSQTSMKTNSNIHTNNLYPNEGFSNVNNVTNNIDSRNSKYFTKLKSTTAVPGILKTNGISGSTRIVNTKDTIADRANRNNDGDPFSFDNYYKKEANVDKSNRNADETPQGAVANINKSKPGSFRTARTELGIQQMKKDKGKPGGSNQNYGNQSSGASASWVSNSIKKTLGTRKARSVHDKFVTPSRPNAEDADAMEVDTGKEIEKGDEEEPINEKYKGIDKVMIERIENEIMDQGKPVTWNDIAGLTFAKQTIQEVIVWPMLRPDIFTGLRRPPKGILLFGPPGTGKTLIGKCVAAQCNATFFCISASTLTSKWYGEGEKMVRALFAVASVHQPSIIFIDEIDSLLCQRSDQENETSRRLKTEFLISLDGAATEDDDQVLVIGATNRPQELDEAARRRLVKRLYIPLPDEKARCEIVSKLLTNITNSLSVEDIEEVGRLTGNMSGADMASLCREASLGPVRCIDLSKIDALDVRPISIQDFRDALNTVRPSVCQADLKIYQDWNQTFGSGRF